jgi:UDP-GlcNAc:undecaprenyl-phosphate/decaprenyl-phosphate GlcNAc-1-phosphate transferase
LIILGFPVLDTLTVMGERMANGRSPFTADKNHFHHRLIRLGLFHTEAVFAIYFVQAVLVIAAFSLRHYSEWALLTGYLAFSALILGGFYLTGRTGWKFKRYDLVDRAIKGHLKRLRGRSLAIKVSFKTTEIATMLLLLLLCFSPAEIPRYFSILATALLALMGVTWFFKRAWMRAVLALVLYPFIPFMVHLSATEKEVWLSNDLLRLLNLCFLLLVFFVVMTLKFTKRKRGFKATPMDFLILFIALIAPYAAGAYAEFKELGAVAAKSIGLFFSYEVLIGELRGEYGKLTIATAAALLVVVVRGFF